MELKTQAKRIYQQYVDMSTKCCHSMIMRDSKNFQEAREKMDLLEGQLEGQIEALIGTKLEQTIREAIGTKISAFGCGENSSVENSFGALINRLANSNEEIHESEIIELGSACMRCVGIAEIAIQQAINEYINN